MLAEEHERHRTRGIARELRQEKPDAKAVVVCQQGAGARGSRTRRQAEGAVLGSRHVPVMLVCVRACARAQLTSRVCRRRARVRQVSRPGARTRTHARTHAKARAGRALMSVLLKLDVCGGAS